MRTLEVVVGGQFGSEAKGHVVQRLTERAQRNASAVQVVRVAGPNAGHTGYDGTGKRWALRQVPVAAVVDGSVTLGIAAGSEIDLPVLLDEIDSLKEHGLLRNKMLWVHEEATMIYDRHKTRENGLAFYPGQETQDLVNAIGSTGKGIGAARADRLMRVANRLKDDDEALDALAQRGIAVMTSDQSAAHRLWDHVIVEGTQGYGLGLHAGFYPQCTSSDCRAIDFLAMAGISPWGYDRTQIWVVARVYPIRVAGNSGPLKDETSWEALGLPEERTTVTHKVRRVGLEDWDLVRRAVEANGGRTVVKVALTMLDQKFPTLANTKIEHASVSDAEALAISKYIQNVEWETGAPVGIITTGPNTASFYKNVRN